MNNNLGKQINGVPGSSDEYDKWIDQGRVFKGGKWYEKAGGTTPQTPVSPQVSPGIEETAGNIAQQVQGLQQQVQTEGITPSVKPNIEPDAGDTGVGGVGEVVEQQQQQNQAIDNIQNVLDTFQTDQAGAEGDEITPSEPLNYLQTIQDILDKPAPAQIDYAQEYKDLLAEKGVDIAQTELTDLETKINELETEKETTLERIRKRAGVDKRFAGTEERKLSEEFDKPMRSLLLQKQVKMNEISMKQNTIQNIMNLKKEDYAEARDEYEFSLNKQLTLAQLLGKEEKWEIERAEDATEQNRKNAQMNWQVMSGLISDSGIAFDELPDATKIGLKDLELRAGFPEGFTASILASVRPDKEVSAKIVSKDKSQVSIIYEDGTVENFSTGITETGTTGDIEGGAMVEFEDGTQGDLSTVDGIKKAISMGHNVAEIKSWLDTNTKMSISTIDSLIKEAGGELPKEKEKREEEEQEAKERSYDNSALIKKARETLKDDYKADVNDFIMYLKSTNKDATDADLKIARTLYNQEQKIVSELGWYARRQYFKL